MLGQRVSLEQFRAHLGRVRPKRRLDRLVVHHFWQPDARRWRGLTTLESVRDYHVRVRGFSDIAYHVIIAPDDTIWLGRPIERAGGHTRGQNARSVGVVYAANFGSRREDRARGLTPDEPARCGYDTGVRACAALCRRFRLDEEGVFFHRDFAPKSCPGDRLHRSAFRADVTAAMEGGAEPYVRLKIDDTLVLGAQVRIVDGVAYGREAALAAALGQQAEGESGLVPVRAYLEGHAAVIPPRGWHPEQGPKGTIYAYTTHAAPEEDRADDHGS